MKFKLAALLVLTLSFFSQTPAVSARENVSDWYIQEFDSKIVVNKDSSLDITERITADCGNVSGKHGIFRILPEIIKVTDGSEIKTPVKLISITDFNGKAINYTQSKNSSDNTITWKIGDADKTVQGVNNYEIHYQVQNTIRFGNADFDELYWNLNGNFWDLEIDKFHASLIFPKEVAKENSKVEYYTGSLGSKDKSFATYQWTAPNVLEFNSTKMLGLRQGITASITFPKNIFIPYQPTFWEKYGKYFALPVPFVVFFICFYFWWKYGRDPRINKTVIAEYDAPGNLSPIELGMVRSNGTFDNDLVTAEIINLATKGLIVIKETNDKVLFFKIKDYTFEKKPDEKKEAELNEPQRKILNKIFEDGNETKLSSLKSSFYTILKDVEDKAKKMLEDKKLLTKSGSQLSVWFVVLAIASFIFGIISLASWEMIYLGWDLIVSAIIVFLFGLAMPKRTLSGAELNWKIKGFKLFMETVDKDRAKFYEKENIFEKFLPYAIVFGITGLWIKKMKEIYGEDYYNHYAPVWFYGSLASFDADSFSSAIDSLSSSIAASTSAPSGSGGAGGAGGGGGGGGGGGW